MGCREILGCWDVWKKGEAVKAQLPFGSPRRLGGGNSHILEFSSLFGEGFSF